MSFLLDKRGCLCYNMGMMKVINNLMEVKHMRILLMTLAMAVLLVAVGLLWDNLINKKRSDGGRYER